MSERRRRYSFESESESENSSEELQRRKGLRSTVNLITTKPCIPRSPSRSPRGSNSSSSESESESGEIGTNSDTGSDEDSASTASGSGETSASSDNDEAKAKSHSRKSPYQQKDKERSWKRQDRYDRRKDKRRHHSEKQDDSSEEEQSRHSHEKRNGFEKNKPRCEDSDDDGSAVKAASEEAGSRSAEEDTAISNHHSHRHSRKRTHRGSDDDAPRSKREKNRSTYNHNERNESTRSEKDTSDKRDYSANSSKTIKSEVFITERSDSEEEAVASEDNRRNGRSEEDSPQAKMSRSRNSPYSSDEDCSSRRDSRRGHSSYSDKGRKTKHRKSEDIEDEYDAETRKRYSRENSRDPNSEKDFDYQRNYSGADRTSSSKRLPARNRHSPKKSKLDRSDQLDSEDTRSARRSKRSRRDEGDRGMRRERSSRERRPDSRERDSRERRADSRGRRTDSSGHDRTSRRRGYNDQDTGRDGNHRSFDRSDKYEHSRDRYWNRFEERKRRENTEEDRDGRERKDRPSYQDRSNRRDRRDGNESEIRPPRKRSAERSTPPKDAANDESKDAPNSAIDKESENYLQAKRSKLQGDESIMTKTGGAYIPPARLRMMQAKITDKASAQYQRIAWEALKKSINGLINKVNISNLKFITCEILQENIVRGRGLLSRSVIQAQAASPTFTQVYAALVAIINTKFPQIGELILKRVVIQFRKGFRRNDKQMCLSAARFASHLVNQQVAHEILALEILTLLLENPTNDSIEVTVAFLKECGQKLTEVSPRGIIAIFDRLRNVLHEGKLPNRTQYIIEVMFAVRKDGFKDHPAVIEELDLVEEDDQFTHMLTLEDAVNSEDLLNVFKFDPEYEANEDKYKVLKKDILDEGSSDDEDGSGSGSGSSSGSDSDDEEEEGETKETIIDSTETNLVALRRSIYLTIQSSLDFEECAHKLLKMELKPGQEDELCNMILDCCAQMRTYEKFFGLLAQRFCMLDQKYIGPFQRIYTEQYETIHRLETNKLRNVAKFFAHLLYTDAISWEVLALIKLNEEDTTSSSRIFIKILFQELSEYMGLPKLNDRLKDPTLQVYFEGLFPRDTPRNTRFAINFFTSIGQGGLTDELRAHLKQAPKPVQEEQIVTGEQNSSSSSSSSSSDSSSSSSNSSSSDSSSSDSSSSDSDDSSSSEEESRKSSKKRKRKSSKKEDLPEPAYSRKEDTREPAYSRKEDMREPAYSRKEDMREPAHSRKEDMPEPEYSRKERHDRYNEEISRNRHDRSNEEISRNRHNHVGDDVSQRRGRQYDRHTRQQEKQDKRAGSRERGNGHDRNKSRHGRDHSNRDRQHRDH